MILELVESDRPRKLGEKVAEFASSPPKPMLKFYGPTREEVAMAKRNIFFSVRNGLPLPLLYGIYAEAKYNGFTDYIEKTDHIGPFSTDDWRLTLNNIEPAEVEIRVGLVPFEILTDRAKISV